MAMPISSAHFRKTVTGPILGRTLPNALSLLKRLDGITGFVTVAGLDRDNRSAVFGRSHHNVERVARISHTLAKQFIAAGRTDIDIDRVTRLAVLHDVNRLPFAHNGEKAANFNQAENMREYLKRNELELAEEEIQDLIAILNKDIKSMSSSARVVFAADTADGYIEDPLLAITALGVSAEFVPKDVAARVGLPFGDAVFSAKLSLLRALYEARRPEEYTETFNMLVFEYATKFLDANNDGTTLFIEIDGYGATKKALREGFMNKQVFPINNGIASKNKKLQKDIVKPMMASLIAEFGTEEEAHFVMLKWTDQDMLDQAVARGIISEDRKADYYPLLDNLQRTAERYGAIKSRNPVRGLWHGFLRLFD
ncbi:HD domain-containing protein [Candidatus Margulisiibacteriota bacterium]